MREKVRKSRLDRSNQQLVARRLRLRNRAQLPRPSSVV